MKNRNPRVVMDGLAFGESPRWHDGRIWFAHWTTREIIAADENGNSEVVVHLPFDSFPVSFDWLSDGRMLIVSRTEGLQVRSADGTWSPYGDLTSLRGTTWNEIVIDGRDNVYINGAGFDPKTRTPGSGMLVLVTPDGKVRPVADQIAFPNGMAVTSDNKTLIVAESYGRKLTAFDVAADGGLHNRRVWADLGAGTPDGICLDREGALWYADVPNRCCVRVREGGEVLQMISADRGCFACMLGGVDETTLFFVAAEWHGFDKMIGAPRTGQLLAVDVTVEGSGWPKRMHRIQQGGTAR